MISRVKAEACGSTLAGIPNTRSRAWPRYSGDPSPDADAHAERLRRIGITEGSPAWDDCIGEALKKIDPRVVPPSVVEAEIARPGSTNVRVITARRGQVAVTIRPSRSR
jgi:hypothetical protein